MLLQISDKIAALSLRLMRWGSWLLVPLILTIMLDVITRKWVWAQQAMVNSPLGQFLTATRLQELEWHLHAVIFLLAFAAAYIRNTHVRVDIWREKQPLRKQAWVEFLGLLFFALPWVGLMVWLCWQFVAKAYVSGEGSASMTGIGHRWVVKSFMLIGMAMLFASLIAGLIRVSVFLFGAPQNQIAALERLPMLNEPVENPTVEAGVGP